MEKLLAIFGWKLVRIEPVAEQSPDLVFKAYPALDNYFLNEERESLRHVHLNAAHLSDPLHTAVMYEWIADDERASMLVAAGNGDEMLSRIFSAERAFARRFTNPFAICAYVERCTITKEVGIRISVEVADDMKIERLHGMTQYGSLRARGFPVSLLRYFPDEGKQVCDSVACFVREDQLGEIDMVANWMVEIKKASFEKIGSVRRAFRPLPNHRFGTFAKRA